jgi:hypothetical protein
VFSYYAHIGYLAENGGRIRGTNGNNSYGDWGSVAEGFDSTETPILCEVDNKAFVTTVGNVLTDGINQVLGLEYDNAGVATSNGEGVAVLKVREPQSYKVPFMGKLQPHVHYRECGEAGWMGRIKSLFLTENKVEGFEDKKTDKNYKIQNLADTAASIY